MHKALLGDTFDLFERLLVFLGLNIQDERGNQMSAQGPVSNRITSLERGCERKAEREIERG